MVMSSAPHRFSVQGNPRGTPRCIIRFPGLFLRLLSSRRSLPCPIQGLSRPQSLSLADMRISLYDVAQQAGATEMASATTTQDFKVKDYSLAEWGRKEISMAED